MNLPAEDLGRWDRDEPMPNTQDDWDNWMMRRRLFYLSGDRDDGQTLVKVQKDLRSDIRVLLDPSTPANAALKQLLYRIDELKLESGRKVLTPEEQHKAEKENDRFMIVDLLRVSPPRVGEKGRRKPVTESLAVREIAWHQSARENLYRMVDGAIRANVVSDLRQCLSCSKFFLRDGRRLTYCSPECETDFNNKRRVDYFKARRKKGQKTKRKRRSMPAKQGYGVFVGFRNIILKGSDASRDDQKKAGFILSWVNLDTASSARTARTFREECKKLDAASHWHKMPPALRQRFKSCPVDL